MALNRSLYERVLRDLLVERAEHTVELYEGAGAAWSLAKCAQPQFIQHLNCQMQYIILYTEI